MSNTKPTLDLDYRQQKLNLNATLPTAFKVSIEKANYTKTNDKKEMKAKNGPKCNTPHGISKPTK
jgi:hypothetical protein